jgi:hypothetical protein
MKPYFIIRNKFHINDMVVERLSGQNHHGTAGVCWEHHIFRYTISSSNIKVAWLWEALYHPTLATSRRILRKRLLAWHKALLWFQHICWHICSLASWLRVVTKFPQPPETVHYGNIVSTITFLTVLVIRKETTLATRVYRKPTHTGLHLNFKSNLTLHAEKKNIKFRVFSVEFPSCSRNDNVCLIKSVA